MAKKLLSLAISGLVLAIIYLKIDSMGMLQVLGHIRLHMFLIAIIFWVP